jgi:hypothetical protein
MSILPKIAKQELAQKRYDICKTCEEFTGVKTCKQCNCFMPVKVKFAQAWCPKTKWFSLMDPRQQQADAYKDLE